MARLPTGGREPQSMTPAAVRRPHRRPSRRPLLRRGHRLQNSALRALKYQRDLVKRILERAADGIFDVAELKRAALEGSVSSELDESQAS